MAWLSICSLRSVGSELLRWQRFKMLMIAMFSIFHHVYLSMSADRYIHLLYTLGKVNYVYFRFLMFIIKAGTLFHI